MPTSSIIRPGAPSACTCEASAARHASSSFRMFSIFRSPRTIRTHRPGRARPGAETDGAGHDTLRTNERWACSRSAARLSGDERQPPGRGRRTPRVVMDSRACGKQRSSCPDTWRDPRQDPWPRRLGFRIAPLKQGHIGTFPAVSPAKEHGDLNLPDSFEDGLELNPIPNRPITVRGLVLTAIPQTPRMSSSSNGTPKCDTRRAFASSSNETARDPCQSVLRASASSAFWRSS